MKLRKLISKQAFVLVVLLLVSMASSAHIRTLLWDDPYCSQFSADGSRCITCSYRYWMDYRGKCQKVSDWCKTWDNSNGCCTSCYQGYGNPVNGVCASAPVTGGSGPIVSHPLPPYCDACDTHGKCTKCCAGYYLDAWGNCKPIVVSLPPNC